MTLLASLTALTLIFLPLSAHAQRFINLATGLPATTSFGSIAGGFVLFLAQSSVAVSIAIFLVGAFYFAIAHGDETYIKRGKDLMIGSVIGMCFVLGAYGLLQIVLYILL